MDLSNSYILKNRWISSFIISLFIFIGTLLIINSLIKVQLETEIFQPISITLTVSKTVQVVKPKQQITEQITPLKLPKPKIVPQEQLESIVPAKPNITLEKIQQPVLPIETTLKTNNLPVQIVKNTTVEVTKPLIESIDMPEKYSNLTPFETISEGLNLQYPDYPKSAIKWKKQGVVEVEIEIGTDGSIKNITLLKSSGHSILDNHCIKIIKKKWKFNKSTTIITTRKKFVFKLI